MNPIDFKNRPGVSVAVLVYVLLAIPPLRQSMEASMAMHMLVQMPILALLGAAAAVGLRDGWRRCQCYPAYRAMMDRGLAGILFAGLVLTAWMIPRVVDASVNHWQAAVAKFLLLPLSGAALASAWPRCPPIAKVVIHLEAIASLLRFGWAYLAAPTRLCSAYLAGEQEFVGAALLFCGGSYALLVASRPLFGWSVRDLWNELRLLTGKTARV